MRDFSSVGKDKSSGFSKMDVSSDFQRTVRACAEPIGPGERVKTTIDRAAKRLGWSWDKAKRAYYGEVKRPYADEYEHARRVAMRLSEVRQVNADHQAQIARLEAALRVQDPDFHSAQIEALERLRS